MRFEFNRNSKAICHTVLASIEIEHERLDIKSALVLFHSGESDFPKRFTAYLKSERLIDGSEFTELGQQVYETGKLTSKEKGLYKIWYLRDDYLKLKPLLIERLSEPSKGGYQVRSNYYDWKKTSVPLDFSPLHAVKEEVLFSNNGECERTKISNLVVEVENESHRSRHDINVNFFFGVNSSEHATFNVSGKLPINTGGKEKLVDIKENYEIEKNDLLLNEIASQCDFKWDKNIQRFLSSVPTDPKEVNEFHIESLGVKAIKTCYGAFTSGHLYDLPLAPKSFDVASEWQERWLNDLYSQSYISEQQSTYRQRIWLKQPALTNSPLKLKSGRDLISIFNRQTDPLSYWHSSATHFLTPKNSRSPLLSITLNKGDVFDVEIFLRYLTLNESIEKIIYSDRHFKSSVHKNNMFAVERYSNPSQGLIFTESKDVKIPTSWSMNVMSHNRDSHDRYWIFTTSENKYIWKVSTSFDYIDFTGTDSKILTPVTFTQIDVINLPDYLKEALNKSEYMEVG